MRFVLRFIHRPQQLWVRRLNFQLHLWVGIAVALYLIVIGMTGSILVFREELESLTRTTPWRNVHARQPFADVASVVDKVERRYPGQTIISVLTPTGRDPVFLTVVQGRRGRKTVASDPATGDAIGEAPRQTSRLVVALEVVRNLHITLLVGPKGRMFNGIGGALLLLLNITGLVIWWPGIKSWKRALAVDFERTWRRVNFDLHRAVGFWTLTIVSFWALSGVYFGWPRQVFNFVNRLSPVISAKPPAVIVNPADNAGDAARFDLDSMIKRAAILDPGTTVEGIEFPYSRRAPLQVFMRRGNGIGREYMDTVYFNPWDNSYISTWRYGVNKSFGDWLIWSQIPLHYGTYWGLGVKILWAVLGLSIPLITITGALMYWNRVLRRKWKRLTGVGRRPGPARARLPVSR